MFTKLVPTLLDRAALKVPMKVLGLTAWAGKALNAKSVETITGKRILFLAFI
jgi:hypothetical protein